MIRKRIAGIVMTAVLSMALLAGCGNKEITLEADGDKPVITVDGESTSYWEANFQTRVLQLQYESIYGVDIWSQTMQGDTTFEESIKDVILEGLKSSQATLNHVKDYDVSVTDDEKEEIKQQAEQFMSSLTDELKTLTEADQEKVEAYLTDMNLVQKVVSAVGEESKATVTDEEARQLKANYVVIPVDSSATDSEVNQAKHKATSLYNQAKKSKDLAKSAQALEFDVNEATYGTNNTDIPTEIIEASMKLQEGEIAKPIKTDYGYYVIQVTEYMNEEATATAKESMLEEKQMTYYNETCQKWLEDAKVTVDEDLWNSIQLAGNPTIPTTESTTESESTTASEEGTTTASTSTEEGTTAAATTEATE